LNRRTDWLGFQKLSAHFPILILIFDCRTAGVTGEGSISDETHLSAAVQYWEFRRVVETMWAMVHGDERKLAEHFYRS
jgi:hypothetical protein